LTSASPNLTRGGRRSIHLAVIGDVREIERIRRARELLRFRTSERPGPAQIDVEPVERGGHGNVERLHQSSQIGAKRARRLNRAGHAGAEQRAFIDRYDVVRPRAHETDLFGRGMGKSGVKRRAAPPRAMRVDKRADLGGNALALQRLDDETALPLAIERLRHVLRGAAATSAEPGAYRLGALGRGAQRLDELRALARQPDARPLAGQGAGNDGAVRGDAVPMRVERDDRKLFERLRHGARQ